MDSSLSSTQKINYLLQATVVVGFVLSLYLLLLGLFRIVTREELDGYPAPVRMLIGKISRRRQVRAN